MSTLQNLMVYDFDDTIYDGDSTVDFYKFCLKKNFKILKYLLKQAGAFSLYQLKVKDKLYFKQTFFEYLKSIDDVDKYVIEFWNANEHKIKDWYKANQDHSNDVIISASPQFLLEHITSKYNINKLIATVVDKKTGKFSTPNCYGEEKVVRFRNEFKDEHSFNIKEFYSDSKSDIYMARLAENSYLVKKDNIKKWIV